jgi:hypothetical protein
MKVANKINPNYVYIVALRVSEEDEPRDGQGPLPVISPPWGNNGFVAGKCTHFVRWDRNLIPEYNLYQFTDCNLSNYRLIGAPLRYNTLQENTDTLEFELNLTQLTNNDPTLAARLRSLQVNFLTMNTTSRTVSRRLWDAIGDNQNVNRLSAITIPLTSSGRYDNNYFGNIEPRGDVSDPDLDIVDFTVQVIRSQ